MRRHDQLSIAALALTGFLCSGAPAAADGPARLLTDINRTYSYDMDSAPRDFHSAGELTFFVATTPETGFELCRTDGTEAGTFMVKDIYPGPTSGVRFNSSQEGSLAFDPAIVNGEAFFMASDRVHGWELWKSDGTEAGTSMVKEIPARHTGSVR